VPAARSFPTMTTIHASAVLIGRKAVLIRGASGSGKSRLALALVEAGRTGAGALPFARLVGDDRVHIEARHGRLLVRPAPELAGLIEVRGLGIRRLPYEPLAAVGLIVDLGAPAARMPPPEAATAQIEGIALPRLAVAAAEEAVSGILAILHTIPAN
jgi:HPr kinase/phosphorylase